MQMTRRGLLATVWATGLAACAGTPAPTGATGARGPDATAMAALIRDRRASAAELVEAAIARTNALQPKLNFMVVDTFEAARARAKGAIEGPFAGVPTFIKDTSGLAGTRTRIGSRATASAPVATKNVVYVDAFLKTGLVCIGKSQTPEGAYLPTTEPLAFGPCHNPWDVTRSTAGSSGGSACAVAAGVVPIAHANDGGGSIRMPAANCGVFGLKPSRGRLVTEQPGSRPLDLPVQGCVSISVRDTAALLAATEASGSAAVYPPLGLVERGTGRKLKIGILTKGLAGHEADRVVADIIHANGKQLEAMGHTLIPTTWPVPESFSDDFLTLWSVAAKADLDHFSAMQGKPVDTTTVEPFSFGMAEAARKLSPADIQAVSGRLIAHAAAYDKWIAGFDVVISPVFASPPSPLGYLCGDVPFGELRQRLLQQVGYTLIQNVSGAAAMSVPLGWTKGGLPVGVQFSAGRGDERKLLELAYDLESAHSWAGRIPEVFAV